jgi:starvation-inducible DNA-binding protein
MPLADEWKAIMSSKDRSLRAARLDTSSDLSSTATRDISGAMAALLADMFALNVKTKNFH